MAYQSRTYRLWILLYWPSFFHSSGTHWRHLQQACCLEYRKYNAMTVCPWPMCPWTCVLWPWIPWIMDPLDYASHGRHVSWTKTPWMKRLLDEMFHGRMLSDQSVPIPTVMGRSNTAYLIVSGLYSIVRGTLAHRDVSSLKMELTWDGKSQD